MAEQLNCRGMKCPQPVLKVAIKAASMPAGSSLEVQADCSTFESDVKKWCEHAGKVLVSCVDHGGYKVATIQF